MTRRVPAALVITGLTLAAAGAQAAAMTATDSQYFRSPSARAAGLPFSEAVQVGGVIYLNNQLGNRPGVGQMVEGGLEGQLAQAMRNIDAVLAARGRARRDIFKCTITLTDMSRWADMNRIWATYFEPDRLPVRNVIGVTGLPLSGVVGVECAAATK